MADRRDEVQGHAGHDWRAIVDELDGRTDLNATEWDWLADALFWVDRVDDSVQARHGAYQAHVRERDAAAATLSSWRIFYEHFLVGEEAIANGWLERARRHAAEAGQAAPLAWVAVADADISMRAGKLEVAASLSRQAADTGRELHDPDLLAMALQILGRALIERGEREAGLRCLDEAMVAVINNELLPLFTGWVYCNVVSTCFGLADLRRANEWSEAALRWCRTLQDGRMYRGLCRVYSVQIACMYGRWDDAASEALVASADLETFDPRYAGAAHHLLGELARWRGEPEAARSAFERAATLGGSPQPGAALLALDHGHVAEAMTAIRNALHPPPSAPLDRARLAMALLTIAESADDASAAAQAHTVVAEAASDEDAPVLDALALAAAGRHALMQGRVETARASLRGACDEFRELGLPFDLAETSCRLGDALIASGDHVSAHAAMAEALAAFERLGATPAAAALRRRASDVDISLPAHTAEPGPLTDREREVLGHVAAGRTNRQIADELILSHHTIARHVSNIFTKLGVNTRAAAAAIGVEQGLLS